MAGSIAQVVDRNQALSLAARPPRAEVAIVYNPLAYFVGGRRREARNSMMGIYRALFPTNVPVDFVHIRHLAPGVLRRYCFCCRIR